MKRLFVGLSILMLFLISLPVYAGAPLDAVKINADQVLDILRDPKLKAASAKEMKKDKLRAVYVKMFDEVELSRRSLGMLSARSLLSCLNRFWRRHTPTGSFLTPTRKLSLPKNQ
jgi:ABC-type transporter MlaC component